MRHWARERTLVANVKATRISEMEIVESIKECDVVSVSRSTEWPMVWHQKWICDSWSSYSFVLAKKKWN